MKLKNSKIFWGSIPQTPLVASASRIASGSWTGPGYGAHAVPWHRLCSGYATVAKRSHGNITAICFQFKQPNIINYIGELLVGMSDIIYLFIFVYRYFLMHSNGGELKKIVVDTDLETTKNKLAEAGLTLYYIDLLSHA